MMILSIIFSCALCDHFVLVFHAIHQTNTQMINLGTAGDKTWDDNWTAVTTDGKRSAQFEHTLVVTETGYELLTGRENEPVMTWKPELTFRPAV